MPPKGKRLKTSDFNYYLPSELIAQTPVTPRDASRLLVLGRRTGAVGHRHFYDLPELLRPGDLLVMNDSRVLPARLLGRKKDTGASVELLLLRPIDNTHWEVLVHPGRKLREGAEVVFSPELSATVQSVEEGGNRVAEFHFAGSFYEIIDRLGLMPLPPYIKEKLQDRERYQTVYADPLGSSAAPTAGLHFTPELLERVRSVGVGTAFLTLHVGVGTFRPVKAANVEEHRMHAEHFTLSAETAESINETKARGGWVIAVGTTTVRTLESVARGGLPLAAESGSTDIFITPGFEFRVIDGLVTNFHLPESTLLMLVSAFCGRENILEAYRIAVEERYRFFSFGDAMLIV